MCTCLSQRLLLFMSRRGLEVVTYCSAAAAWAASAARLLHIMGTLQKLSSTELRETNGVRKIRCAAWPAISCGQLLVRHGRTCFRGSNAPKYFLHTWMAHCNLLCRYMAVGHDYIILKHPKALLGALRRPSSADGSSKRRHGGTKKRPKESKRIQNTRKKIRKISIDKYR